MVKVVYFDRVLQVFILKGLTVRVTDKPECRVRFRNSVWYLPFVKHDDYLTNDGHVCLFSKLLSGNEPWHGAAAGL